MSDSDKSLYSLRYNQVTSNLEAFGGGSPQWTLVTLNNVDPMQVPITRQINTTAPLTGGGNLTVDRTLSIPQSNGSTDGYLSSVDWTTFNNKQTAGNYITALTGDATAMGPGSVPLTLATVNGNVGTFTYASITVNAKGLITSASSGVFGSLTDVGTDGITVTGGTGAVVGAGTSLSQHVADASHNGYLSQTDWGTFNSKLTSTLASADIFVGNGSNVATAVALSGDATLSNTGALTLATVNGNVGSFTNASITVDAKGRITAASNGASSGITQLTGDVTAGPGSGSQVATLATVNSNVGSFTNASVTVNAKGLITAASSGTAPVTSVSGTANQITSTGGSTPVLALASPLITPGNVTVTGSETITATTNQLILGTTNTTTITAPAPAASRTYTIADAGGADTFAFLGKAQTFTGSQTLSSTSGNPIHGISTNTAATAGYVGEVIRSTAVTTFTSNTPTTLTSISVTAGNWIIYASVYFHTNTTLTQAIANVTTTGNSVGGIQGIERMDCTTSNTTDSGVNISYPISLSTTTTYFLSVDLVGTGTLTSGGQLFAVRTC